MNAIAASGAYGQGMTAGVPIIIHIALDALARTTAAIIAEAPGYHEALDAFRACLEAALLTEG